MIKAENGVLNLNEMFFNGSVNRERQLPQKSGAFDSFARTLDSKLSERIENRRLNEKKGLAYGNSKGVNKKFKTPKADHNRMPKAKLNKEKDLKSFNERLDELKKALKDSKGKTTQEVEKMFAAIMGSQEITEEQVAELETMIEDIIGMEELVLSQSILKVLDDLPDELMKKVKQLVSEIANGKGEIMTEHGQLQEKVDQLIVNIDETISQLELDGELKSKEDLAKLLEVIKSNLNEGVQGNKVVNPESVEQIKNFSEIFKMVESIEKKSLKNNVEKLQGLMNQKSLPVDLESGLKAVETKPGENLVNEVLEAKVNKELPKGSEDLSQKNGTNMEVDLKEVNPSGETPKESRSQIDVKDGGFKEVIASQNTVKTNGQSINSNLVEQSTEQTLGIKELTHLKETQSVKMVQSQRNIMNQVIEGAKMNFNLEDETSEMLIKLKPHSLGNVELKVSIEKGVLLAEFNVESQVVKEALEANLTDLRNALGDKGFNIHELNVSVNQEGKQGNNQQFTRRQNNKRSEIQLGSLESVFENSSLESLNSSSTIDFLG